MGNYQYNLSIGAAIIALGVILGLTQGTWGVAAVFIFLGVAWQKRNSQKPRVGPRDQ